MKSLLYVFLLSFSIVHARSFEAGNYFYLPPEAQNTSGLEQAQYENILSAFNVKFFSEVWTIKNRPLIVALEWESPYFGAFALDRSHGYEIHLWGGLARAPGMTKTLMNTILCHELGHIIGGEPLQTITGGDWASSEGQSDFFAASFCLPKILESKIVEDTEALQYCEGHQQCAQIVMAGLEFVKFFQIYSSTPTQDVSIHAQAPAASELLRNTYPSDQCRLDTFKAAALCAKGDSCKTPSCLGP